MDRRPWGKGDERWFWVWLCAAPLLLILSIEFITRVSPLSVFSWLGREPAAFLLTYLAVACLMLLAALAVKRLWIGILIPAVPALILCVVNYLKLSVNGIGLVVSDMALAGNAGTLMEFMPPKLRFPGWGILATVLLVGAVVAAKVLAPALPKDLQGKCRDRKSVV